MSIKAFHIFFIIVSILTSIGLAVWSFREYSEFHESATLTIAILSSASGIMLSGYCLTVIKKFSSIR
jgi:hypothetical protein